jgi:DNA-binding transcriptional ArsR family regulator
MDSSDAIMALAALAQETRLAVFRLLVRQGPSGLPAGAIAAHLSVPASTLSFHLKELERAGLVGSTRAQRQIVYACDYAGMRDLLTFLTADCCAGHPAICDDLGCADRGAGDAANDENPECRPGQVPADRAQAMARAEVEATKS